MTQIDAIVSPYRVLEDPTEEQTQTAFDAVLEIIATDYATQNADELLTLLVPVSAQELVVMMWCDYIGEKLQVI